MKEFFLYNINPEVEAALQVSKLLSVATLHKLASGTIMDTNELPALSLFNNKTLQATSGGYKVVSGDKVVGFVEPTTEGADFRYYNSGDKLLATQVRLLVLADPAVDGIVNPGIRVKPVTPGVVLIENITTLNGKLWSEQLANRTIQMKGFHYVVTGVSDSNFGSLKYLLEGNGYNQLGASRKSYIKLANRPVSLTTDLTGESQKLDDTADYVYSAKDIADLDQEFLAMNFIFAVKNESEYLRIPFSEIFNA